MSSPTGANLRSLSVIRSLDIRGGRAGFGAGARTRATTNNLNKPSSYIVNGFWVRPGSVSK